MIIASVAGKPMQIIESEAWETRRIERMNAPSRQVSSVWRTRQQFVVEQHIGLEMGTASALSTNTLPRNHAFGVASSPFVHSSCARERRDHIS